MKNLSEHYPAIPQSLLTSPLDAMEEDIQKARRIISLIAVRHRVEHGLTMRNMAVIPQGLRYHGILVGRIDGLIQVGDLQITEPSPNHYSVLGYSNDNHLSIPVPIVMMMGVQPLYINDVLDDILATVS